MGLRSVFIAAVASLSCLCTADLAVLVSPQSDALRALDGEWVFLEDLTEGRTLEQLTPPMGSKFTFRVEEGAVILVSGHGGARQEVRVALDGKATEIPGSVEGEIARYSGAWKDGSFAYEVAYVRGPDKQLRSLIKRDFKVTKEGLVVRSNLGSGTEYGSIGLYRHPKDIPMPTAVKATINDLAWLSGAWLGSRISGSSIEELWSSPKGGAMLATSRSINTSGKMSAFEFLRVVERDSSLVYIAQPGGGVATEFVLSELTPTRAVFDNPRHDYPKRIVYEVSADGSLVATVGFIKGGTPRRYEYKRQPG